MAKRMTVIGLTGSIGMGKSTVGAMMEAHNIPVFDSDKYVHELSGPNGKAVQDIIAHFPQCWDTRRRCVDRKKLRDVVFTDNLDPERQYEAQCSKKTLESILHPLVQDAQQKFINKHRRSGTKIVALDIPLLFETGAQKRVDYTLTVSAPEDLQCRRVLGRPNMTEEKFLSIWQNQMPDHQKRLLSDFVVRTGCSRSRTQQELLKAIREIKRAG